MRRNNESLFGVFATRAPRRPNSLGLSVVKLLGVEGWILHIENVDILDNTPCWISNPMSLNSTIRQGCV